MKVLVKVATLLSNYTTMPRPPQVHFRLEPEDENKMSLIYLQFLYNKRRLYFSFGQKIKVSNWNYEKEEVKSKKETTEDGKHSLNDLLDSLKKVCNKSYTTELKNGIPEPEVLKKYLQDFIDKNKRDGNNDPDNNKPGLFKLADRFISGEIKNKGKSKSSASLKNYHAVTTHLKEFQYVKSYPVTFDSITLDFFYQYVDFLANRSKYEQKIKAFRPEIKKKPINDLAPNTIAKDISILKVFMTEAVDLGYTTNMQYKHKKFSYGEVEIDAVALSEKEINIVYKHDFSNNAKLDNVRDLLVSDCWLGLRFSDYSKIKPENIIQLENDNGTKDYFIKTITQKTNELVYIPCHPIVLQIMEKYKDSPNKLPRPISNQKFNDYVKLVCKEAGLTEKGRLAEQPEKELWECIGSHTCRRTFATYYYLDGFPVIDLMKITGHKTEKAFMKYIKVTKLDAAKRLSAHMKKRWSEKVLKVA